MTGTLSATRCACGLRLWRLTVGASHLYRPGERTGDALPPCSECGAMPTAEGFAATHEPSRDPGTFTFTYCGRCDRVRG